MVCRTESEGEPKRPEPLSQLVAPRAVGAYSRHWGQHQTIHDPAQLVAAARMLRRTHRDPGPGQDEVQVRALGHPDRMLSLDEGVA